MEYGQLLLRLSGIEATKNYHLIMALKLLRAGLFSSLDEGQVLTADQTAQLVYLSAATNLDNCDAAIYMISEDRSPAWSEEAYTDIISYLAFMIQDTWRPVGMVDHITFFRNSGAAITVNETDRTLMYRFDSCLPNNTPGKDDSNLSGWDLARIAAAYCGDVVVSSSPTTLTRKKHEADK